MFAAVANLRESATVLAAFHWDAVGRRQSNPASRARFVMRLNSTLLFGARIALLVTTIGFAVGDVVAGWQSSGQVASTVGVNADPADATALDNKFTWQNGSLSFKIKACCNATGYCPPIWPLEGVEVSYTVVIFWRDAQNTLKTFQISDTDGACPAGCVQFPVTANVVNGVGGTIISVGVAITTLCTCCSEPGGSVIEDPDYPSGSTGHAPTK